MEIIHWEERGYIIQGVYADPIEAMDAIRSGKPDVVFTDIRMHAMTGIEMIEALKAEGVDSEFILVSAYQDFAYAQQGIGLGVFSYIVKPFDIGEIEKNIAKLTERLYAKNAQLIFPLHEAAFYDSPNVSLFFRKAMTSCFYRIVMMSDACAVPPHAVQLAVEGGIRAWFCPFPTAERARDAFQREHAADIGVSRIHDAEQSFHSAIQEAYYARYCQFGYVENESVSAIQLYLCANMERQISVVEIARHFNFSTAYLCTLFKRCTRQTIVQFQQHVRVQFARHLMIDSNKKLRDIARLVGYDDYSYFGKIFKALSGGTSPEAFRRDNAELKWPAEY